MRRMGICGRHLDCLSGVYEKFVVSLGGRGEVGSEVD
jgi:hypothetical protein